MEIIWQLCSFVYFGFWVILSGAQDLFLALHSGITLGGARGPYGMLEQSQVGACDKVLYHYITALAPVFGTLIQMPF